MRARPACVRINSFLNTFATILVLATCARAHVLEHAYARAHMHITHMIQYKIILNIQSGMIKHARPAQVETSIECTYVFHHDAHAHDHECLQTRHININ